MSILDKDFLERADAANAVSMFLPDFHEKLARLDALTEETKERSSRVSKSLSVGNDSSAGLFVPEQQGPKPDEICPRCSKHVTEDLVTSCEDPDCPYNYLRKIRGDAEPEGVKEKEEPFDGEEEEKS